MSESFSLKPMGFEHSVDRMRQLMRRAGLEQDSGDFRQDMVRLSGEIGGFAPFKPFGPGASVRAVATPESLKPMIESAARENDIPPELLDALVAVESGYDVRARSRAGAMGLAQLMPGTASGLGVQDPFDPAQNLRGGARYLKQMLDRFGELPLALAAYNAGPARVEQSGGIPNYTETRNYVEKVTRLYRERLGS
jgi:soluble lytic murein transglycosylase-like protein